jgi:2-iminobutanoate/2-iminopropanoate deaminase
MIAAVREKLRGGCLESVVIVERSVVRSFGKEENMGSFSGRKESTWLYGSGEVDSRQLGTYWKIHSETRQVLSNIQRILEGCGATMADVVKCGVFLADVKDFAAMNEVYAEFFGNAKPARTTIGVGALPLQGAKVEIDAVAYKPE